MARGRRDGRCDRAVEDEERRVREENQRLLYVALTRARDRLYVTGWQTRQPGLDPAACWHATVAAALFDHPEAERLPLDLGRAYAGDAYRLRRGAEGAVAAVTADVLAEPAPLPAWAAAPAPPEPPAPRPIAP